MKFIEKYYKGIIILLFLGALVAVGGVVQVAIENNTDKQQEEDNNQDELKQEEIEKNENGTESEVIEEIQDNNQEQDEDIKEEQEDSNTTIDTSSNNTTKPNTSNDTTKPNTSNDTQNDSQTNDTGNNQNDSNTQDITGNNTTTEETEKFITLKKLWIDAEGATFRSGDTFNVYAIVESKYHLLSCTISIESLVNNSVIQANINSIPESETKEYYLTIPVKIPENAMPGQWSFGAMVLWDKYETTEFIASGATNFDFNFYVIE